MKVGTRVVATAQGVVSFAGNHYGYGNLVVINHGANIYTLYAHGKLLNVKAGQTLASGHKIMESGNTGRWRTGPHLHYEVIRSESGPDKNGVFSRDDERFSPASLQRLLLE